jgi:hypothetical protein
LEWTAGAGQKGDDCQKKAEQDCRDRTSRTGLPRCAAKIGLLVEDCKEKTAEAEQKGEDSKNRIGRNKTPVQNCPERTARTGLSAHDY